MEYQKNITYLNELPELDDLEPQQESYPSEHNDIDTSKYIRNFSKMSPQNEMYHRNSNHRNYDLSNSPRQQTELFTPTLPFIQDSSKSLIPSCLDVHGHIVDCPICSKFFKFDGTVYIIVIVLLVIICILLLKKVLNL